MLEFLSEPIEPCGPAADTAAMARGEPGVPVAFRWRSNEIHVLDMLERWKASGPERGRLHGERYLRRHYFKLAMSDGSIWTVYLLRQPPTPRSSRRRWFLLEREIHAPDNATSVPKWEAPYQDS